MLHILFFEQFKQLRRLFRAVKIYKAAHPEWKLIEVNSHDGEMIEILV